MLGKAAKALPLAGIRVLDFSRILAGPWAGQLLADLGADVIKVENPDGGDDTRRWGPPFVGPEGGPRTAAYYLSANRNKRSIALNLRSPHGVRLAQELCMHADVLVENYLPGKLSQLGLGYDALSARNPRLIYASLSGWGAVGPRARQPGYDVAAAAIGGLMSITGEAGRPPVKVGVAVTDLAAGGYLTSAILAALYQRDAPPPRGTGRGQHVQTSLLEAQIANLANIGSNVLNAGWPTRRWGSEHESIVPYCAFNGSSSSSSSSSNNNGSDDAGEAFVVAAMNDAQFRALAAAVGLPALGTDSRYASNEARVAHRAELLPLLAAELAKRPRAHWLAALPAVGVSCTPINSVAEALAEPQVAALGMIQPLPHEEAPPPQQQQQQQQLRVTAHPVTYDGVRPPVRRGAPSLGQHTVEVLAEVLGLTPTEVQQLQASTDAFK